MTVSQGPFNVGARHSQREISKSRGAKPDVEDRWKTLLAAAALLATLVASGIGATATVAAANRAADTALRAQMADRFTKAIEELADDKSDAVRLGGVHSLLKMAGERDSDYQGVVSNVLGDYITHRLDLKRAGTSPPALVQPGSDILAALIYGTPGSTTPMNLSRTDLRGVRLQSLNLHKADLSGSDLSRSELQNLTLESAVLDNARLSNAHVAECSLINASLKGARVTGTLFEKVSLGGADLTGTDIVKEQLSSTTFDPATKWPAGLVVPSAPSGGDRK